MTAFSRFIRATVAAALAAVMLATSVLPASAGTAETAYLTKFVGSWNGSGKLTGVETGTVTCKLVFKMNGAKLNYSGRCNFKDMGAQSFSGSLASTASSKQYESRSNGRSAVGQKNGNTLTFTNTLRTVQGSGTTTMSLSPSSLTMNTTLKDSKGQTSKVRLSFKKA
ncbi:MAG: hypothetical protein ABL879_11355 [Devosia sp.]